jgi:hypothetical protein
VLRDGGGAIGADAVVAGKYMAYAPLCIIQSVNATYSKCISMGEVLKQLQKEAHRGASKATESGNQPYD